MIISASRRTDIPAHYLPWLLERLKAGFCLVASPFDARLRRRVSLEAADLDCLVLWTRDLGPLLAHLDELGELCPRFIVHLSLTGYPRAIEPGVPAWEESAAAAADFAQRAGPERLVWRYDPILLADGIDAADHASNFSRLAGAMEGSSSRLVLSLLDEYAGTRTRLARAGYPNAVFGSAKAAPPARGARVPEPWATILAGIATTARARGFRPSACAEPYDLGPLGIEAGACIDSSHISSLFGRELTGMRDRGQRKACRCAPSVDIGAYGSCPAGCAYCYASRGGAIRLMPRPGDESLGKGPTSG